jgi:hypothetical protein
MNPELRTVIANLETAQRNKDWGMVDRAIQRLAEFTVRMADVEHR